MQTLFLMPDTWEEWRAWLRDDVLAAAIIIGSILLLNLLFRRIVTRFLHRAMVRAASTRREDPQAIERRAHTLTGTISWLVTIFLVFIGAALVLDNFGLNVSALVASVGIAGLAIGLGAQSLIRDVINGTFILVEDQYGVGDVVTVAGISGQVIEINPRRTVLRDLSGNVHTIPNSAISVATNMTKGFSRINLDVTVPREIETNRAIRLVNETCDVLATQFPDDVLSAPRVLRIDSLTEGGVILKVVGDVRAGRQWDVTGELRLRIKERFDREGDDLLQPLQRVVLRDMLSGQPNGDGAEKEADGPKAPPPPENPFIS